MSNLDAVLPYSSEIRDKVKSSIEKAYSDLDIKDEIDSNFIDYIDLLIENGKPLREIANSISEFAGSNISSSIVEHLYDSVNSSKMISLKPTKTRPPIPPLSEGREIKQKQENNLKRRFDSNNDSDSFQKRNKSNDFSGKNSTNNYSRNNQLYQPQTNSVLGDQMPMDPAQMLVMMANFQQSLLTMMQNGNVSSLPPSPAHAPQLYQANTNYGQPHYQTSDRHTNYRGRGDHKGYHHSHQNYVSGNSGVAPQIPLSSSVTYSTPSASPPAAVRPPPPPGAPTPQASNSSTALSSTTSSEGETHGHPAASRGRFSNNRGRGRGRGFVATNKTWVKQDPHQPLSEER